VGGKYLTRVPAKFNVFLGEPSGNKAAKIGAKAEGMTQRKGEGGANCTNFAILSVLLR
jgi:hypothetical protein